VRRAKRVYSSEYRITAIVIILVGDDNEESIFPSLRNSCATRRVSSNRVRRNKTKESCLESVDINTILISIYYTTGT